MIIIEGFDGTGKTILAWSLVDKFKLDYIHSPGPKTYREMFQVTDNYLSIAERSKRERKPYPYIHDRFAPLVDQVYGPILRSLDPFKDLDEGLWLLERLFNIRPLLICCVPGYEDVMKVINNNVQMEGVIDESKELYNAYLGLFQELTKEGHRTVSYDFTKKDDYTKIIKRVEEYINGDKIQTESFWSQVTGKEAF